MGYFKDTVKGVTWMGLLRGSTRLFGLIRIVILARLLSPEQFGLFGIATLALAFLEILTETGINVFLIQDEGDLDEYLNTAWIVSIVRGVLISLAIILFTPLISVFFKNPESKHILYFIAIVPFLRGFINPAIVKFQKKLQFHKEFYFRVAIFAFDAAVTIIVAFITRSVTSLVWGLTAGVILEIILSYTLVKPRPKLQFDLRKIKRVINRGKWLTAAGIFHYLFHQGDDLVVGRLLGAGSLGLYQLAYKVSTLPIYETGEIFNKVTFPIYTRMLDEKARLRKAFFRITLMISLFAIPFGLILLYFPKEVVNLVLGDRWLAAVPAVKVLAIFGVIRAISGTTHPLFLAFKKQEYITWVTLVSIIGLSVSIIPLVNIYGITGAAISALIGSLLSLPVMIYYVLKVLK